MKKNELIETIEITSKVVNGNRYFLMGIKARLEKGTERLFLVQSEQNFLNDSRYFLDSQFNEALEYYSTMN